MTFPHLLKEKSLAANKIKEHFKLPKTNKALGLIKVDQTASLPILLEGLQILPVNFIVISDKEFDLVSRNIAFIQDDSVELLAFDFFVTDDNNYNINKSLTKGVVPIVHTDHHAIKLLQEFNPIKNEGNSYIFSLNSPRAIFHAIIRYLENYKFPFDNKNLVKKLFDM